MGIEWRERVGGCPIEDQPKGGYPTGGWEREDGRGRMGAETGD